MKFYIEGWKGNRKEIGKQEAVLTVGADMFKKMMADAAEMHDEDPDTQIEFMVSGGRLVIEF